MKCCENGQWFIRLAASYQNVFQKFQNFSDSASFLSLSVPPLVLLQPPHAEVEVTCRVRSNEAGVNGKKLFFCSSLTLRRNKLECFVHESLFSLI